MSLKRGKRLGAGTTLCFKFSDLQRAASQGGFTPAQEAHYWECMECRLAYIEYMRLRRNMAREKLQLDPWEDVASKALRSIYGKD